MKGKVIPQWQPEQLNVTPSNRATWRSQVETERTPATSFLPGPGIASLRTSPEDLGTASPAPPNLTQQSSHSQLGRGGGREETTSKEVWKPRSPFMEEI